MRRRSRRKKDIEKISEVIANSPNLDILKLGMELLPILENWKEVMGEDYYRHTSFSGYRKKVLYIKTPDNATLNRLIYEKERIIGKIRELIDAELVEDIFFELEEDDATKEE